MKRYLFLLFITSTLQVAGVVDDSSLQFINKVEEINLIQSQKLRVMTYNMLYNIQAAEEKLPEKHRWKYRFPRLLEYLDFAQADVIGSQELQEDQVEEVMAALGDLYCYYGIKTRENEGRSDVNAIFYNPSRLELLHTMTVPYEDEVGQNAFTYCYFRDKIQEKNFFVLNTKLTWGASLNAMRRRMAEATQLNEFANLLTVSEPILLLGDFNSYFIDGRSIESVLTKDNLKDARDLAVYGQFGPDCSITNSKYLFTPFTGPELAGFILDHIFVNDQVEVLAHIIDTAKVDGEYPSDHFPVVVDLLFR